MAFDKTVGILWISADLRARRIESQALICNNVLTMGEIK